MAVEPHRLRGGRPTVQAYRNDPLPVLRGFVPVESLAAAQEVPMQPADGMTGTASSDGMPPAAVATRAGTQPTGTPPAPLAFVIEPDPDWDERTSLFGDPES